jgi:hypothetical protein
VGPGWTIGPTTGFADREHDEAFAPRGEAEDYETGYREGRAEASDFIERRKGSGRFAEESRASGS